MVDSEGVTKIENGEDETEELAESDDQSDHKGGTLCGQCEDSSDANIPGEHVKDIIANVLLDNGAWDIK